MNGDVCPDVARENPTRVLGKILGKDQQMGGDWRGIIITSLILGRRGEREREESLQGVKGIMCYSESERQKMER